MTDFELITNIRNAFDRWVNQNQGTDENLFIDDLFLNVEQANRASIILTEVIKKLDEERKPR